MKVLLVDDSVLGRMSLRNILDASEYDFTYMEASTGAEAVKTYKKTPADLVIMDNIMPEMDGLTAMKKIIEIDKDAKVIICSAEGYREKVIAAVKAGAVYFLAKPYEAEKVIDSIKKILGL